MIPCRGCGQMLHETALTCPHCGAPQRPAAGTAPLPDGVKGWSWGAFFLNWIWGPFNGTWIALLCLIPYVGFVMAIVLGFKGREWAWRNRHWDSVEHFNRVQRRWSIWGTVVVVGSFVIGVLAAIALPAYHDVQRREATGRTRVSIEAAPASVATA